MRTAAWSRLASVAPPSRVSRANVRPQPRLRRPGQPPSVVCIRSLARAPIVQGGHCPLCESAASALSCRSSRLATVEVANPRPRPRPCRFPGSHRQSVQIRQPPPRVRRPVRPPRRHPERFPAGRHNSEHQEMSPKERRIDFLMGPDGGNIRDGGNGIGENNCR